MRHYIFAAALLLLGPLFAAIPAHAQATRTWVSGVGDDANPCSRTAPCKTFAGAISKTAPAGEINCLDPGGFGTLTITKSLSILCTNVMGGVLAASAYGMTINAGATDVINLQGLDIDGAGTGITGIRVLSAGTVNLTNVAIRNFNAAAPDGNGVIFNPTVNPLKFTITDSTIYDVGTATTGAAIVIRPGPVGVAGIINRVVISRAAFGIAADGNGNASSAINVTVQDSAINAVSQSGIVVTTGANGAGMMVARTAITNSGTGLLAAGSGAILRIGSSEITGNGTGVSGTVLSYGNNQLNGNGVDGTLTPVPGGLH